MNRAAPNESPPDDNAIGVAFLVQARDRLGAARELIVHCASQLNDEQLWWRPSDRQNSIGNLILHVTGNVRERIISVVDGEESVRDRAREFAERGPIPRDDLLAQFGQTVSEADTVLAGLPPARLLEPRSYQGINRRFDLDVMSVILHTLLHLAGHAQEIVFMTRLTLGDVYKFANPVGK